LFFRIGDSFSFSLISNLLFLVFAGYFLKDVKEYPLKFTESHFTKKESSLLLFIKYFIFIIVLTNFVLISTIGVHELSHVLVSRFYECESKSIFYEDGKYPYSEIVCDDLSGKNPIALSGVLIPILVGLILLVIGGNFIKAVSFLIIGFNLIASYKDFQEVGFTSNILLVSSVIGMIFLFIGLVFLAKSRMHENDYNVL